MTPRKKISFLPGAAILNAPSVCIPNRTLSSAETVGIFLFRSRLGALSVK